MAFNDLMHPRNIYRNSPPDFIKLAEQHEEFRKHTKQGKFRGLTIDFKDPEALRALNCTLLEHDFGLKLEIPLDRLIPTVPLRLNYVLWLEDLLCCLPKKEEGETDVVRGIDIGAGSSCIYPLLGAKLNGWNFLGTEVDDTSISFARKNIKINGFEEKIKVKKVTPGSYLQQPLEDEEEKLYDFCMCNPPFFASEAEAAFGEARSEKRPQPSSLCTGIPSETVVRGGEVGFVKGIIDDSVKLKEKIRWYTTMLGKKSSLAKVLSYLKENGVGTVTTTEFCQGRTMRWGVAWTFLPGVQPESSPSQHRKQQSIKKAKPLRFVIPDNFMAQLAKGETADTIGQLAQEIKRILEDLEVDVQQHRTADPSSKKEVLYYCLAARNTWSHQRRRRRERKRQAQKEEDEEEPETKRRNVPDEQQNVKDDTEEEQHGERCDTETGHSLEQSKECSDRLEQSKESSDRQEQSMEGSDRLQQSKEGSDWLGQSKEVVSETLKQSKEASDRLPVCNFFALLTTGKHLNSELPADAPVLEMQWLDGENKNDLYQLFQYLQNRMTLAC